MSNIILSESPEFNTNMEAMERTTPAHYDEWNHRHKQLLENDQFLHDKVNEIENITGNSTENVFSKEKTYQKGNYCIYDNNVYEFTGEKSPGEWDPSVVRIANLLDICRELNSRIEDLERRMGGYSFYSPPLTDEEYEAIDPHDPDTIYPVRRN